MLDRDSYFSQVRSRKITNPLVTALVIGNYRDSTLPNIQTANTDYENIINSFNTVYGYCVVLAQNTKNSDDFTLTQFGSRDVSQIRSCNFKRKWSCEEIDDFNDQIKKNFIDNDGTNFDGLIYVVSCHGDGKSIIYDSKGEDFSLSCVYYQFDNNRCRNLRNKPKIYLLDIYRIGSGNSNSYMHNCTSKTIPYDSEKKDLEVSISDKVTTTKNNYKSVKIPAVAATYTTDSHFRKIIGNSGQQPISNKNQTIGHSIFIQCLTDTVKHKLHANLTDFVVETRCHMSAMLKLDKNSGINAIVLSDDCTMPYETQFGKQKNDYETKMDESHQNMVCILVLMLHSIDVDCHV